MLFSDLPGTILEHLHQCHPALKILDKVQRSYLVNPLEGCCDLGKMYGFQDPVGACLRSNGAPTGDPRILP
jgi:hypothetical protein